LLVVAKEEGEKDKKSAAAVKSPHGAKNHHLVSEVISLVEMSKVSLSHANEKECKSFKFRASKHRYEFFLQNGEHCRGWVEILTSSLAKANEARENTLRRKASAVNGNLAKVRPAINQVKPAPVAPKKANEEEFSYG